MRLWIDCEWNGFGGDLISIALVDENNDYFYEELPCINPIPWIKQNVMQHLNNVDSKLTYSELQEKLCNFLSRYDSIHIIADWPEDIERFCRLLIKDVGIRYNTPPLTMEVVRIDAKSKIPHHALHDAMGLKGEML